MSYRGKPDFSKNHIFKKISEIHFSSDCKNFNRYESRIPKSIDNSNLKVLARIIKKVQNSDHFQKIFEKFWGPNLKFCFQQFFSPTKISTFWKFQRPSPKTEGGVLILLKITFCDLAAMTFDLSGFWKVVTQALLLSNNIS